MTIPVFDATVQRAFERMASDVRRVFGDRFVALVASGPGAAAAFASEIRSDDLDALSALTETWHRDGLATPLLMTPSEFHRSLDTFPAEYQALIDHHLVIAGTSPLDGAVVNTDDLRRACEAQARGHLIHMRQGWLNSGGHAHALADLIEQSAAPLRQVLTNLARLQGEMPGDDAALAAFAEARTGMPRPLVAAILDLERMPHQSRALVPQIGEYLAASERLWTFCDTWPAR